MTTEQMDMTVIDRLTPMLAVIALAAFGISAVVAYCRARHALNSRVIHPKQGGPTDGL